MVPLPEYSASQIPPEYSSLPLPEEQSLSYSLPHSRRPRPTGTFIKTKKGILTLALSGQENDTTVPIYDDLVPVDGIVTLENRDNIVSVELKVCYFFFIVKATHPIPSSKASSKPPSLGQEVSPVPSLYPKQLTSLIEVKFCGSLQLEKTYLQVRYHFHFPSQGHSQMRTVTTTPFLLRIIINAD